MRNASIEFEPSGRKGIVACETYLLDAAKRLGVRIEAACGRRGECDSCLAQISAGGELLSSPTSAEIKILGKDRIASGARLACQAKIESEGKIVAMTKEKEGKKSPEETGEQKRAREFRSEFDSLPLEKKIAWLLDMEVKTLGETISFVIKSPFEAFDKAVEVLAEFGFRFDVEKKKAERPAEHHVDEKSASKETGKSKPRKGKASRKRK
jgi:ferredoxin